MSHDSAPQDPPLVDPSLVAEIRRIEQATGRKDVFSGFVAKLQASVGAFPADFSACLARGEPAAAVRTAHTLKGTCRQLGALALGELFAEIERCAKEGDFPHALRLFEAGGALVAASFEALRSA
jgi:HPt (histidine-containing phosphotransfer) domain-containing protein